MNNVFKFILPSLLVLGLLVSCGESSAEGMSKNNDVIKSEVEIDGESYHTYAFPLKLLGINSTDKCVMLKAKGPPYDSVLHCGSYW